jgi:hypothetical protein
MTAGFPLSSRTLGILVEAIDEGYEDRRIGTLLLKAGADSWQPATWPNKQTRLQRVFDTMRKDSGEEASVAVLELVRLVLGDGDGNCDVRTPTTWYPNVRAAVAADGWDYDPDSGRLLPMVPGIQVAEEASLLEEKMEERGWSVASGHYRQALSAFGARNWASANAQLRSVLEDVLRSSAEFVSGKRPAEVQSSLDALRAKRVLLDGEFGFAKGLWTMCQSRGPHAGLSDEEEARFRLVTVSSYSRFLLARLPELQ